MKTLRNSLIISVLVVLVLGAFAFALPTMTVSAQAPTPTTPKPQDQTARQYARLEKAFQMEQKALERQQEALGKADTTIGKIETLIAKFKEKGADTSKIEAALKSFKEDVASAKKLNEKAAGVLKTHAGFNDQGKVTDPAQARSTLKSAGEAIREAHKTMAEGRKDLWQVIKEWRENWIKNHPKPAPKP